MAANNGDIIEGVGVEDLLAGSDVSRVSEILI